MTTPNLWTAGFQVNTGLWSTGFSDEPMIAALTNGHFVVAWEEGIKDAVPDLDIAAKIFDEEGGTVRDSFQLNINYFIDDEGDFDLAGTHDGFAITYVDDDRGVSNESAIIYERFGLDGTVLSDPGTVTEIKLVTETDEGFTYNNPQLAISLDPADDDVYVGFEKKDGSSDDIEAAVADDGGAFGSVTTILDDASASIAYGDVAVLANGNFVTAYRKLGLFSLGMEVFVQTPDLVTVGTVQSLGSTFGGNPKVAGLEGGGYAVAYAQINTPRLFIRDNSGAAVAEVTLGDATTAASGPDVVALYDGSLVVSWFDFTDEKVVGQRVAADGTLMGSIFEIATVTTPLFVRVESTVLADGRVAFTWADTGTSGSDIFAAIWDPRGDTINPDDYSQVRKNFLSTNVITTNVTDTTVLAASGAVTVKGQGGNDTITGSNEADLLFGGSGNDSIIGAVGNDSIGGDAGADTLRGRAGDDSIDGGADNDVLDGGADNDTIGGFTGDDTLLGGNGDDQLDGQDDNDVLSGGKGDDLLIGGFGDDKLTGGADNDTLQGGEDNDTLDGRNGEDSLEGGFGDDVMRGGSQRDTMDGGGGDDRMFGGNGADSMIGGDDHDLMRGDKGNDTVSGGKGNDTVEGSGGDDVVNGGNGIDLLRGDSGNDTLNGGKGADTVNGGSGEDLIILGNADLVKGGSEADTFQFSTGLGGAVIEDFEIDLDVIDMSGTTATAFGDLTIVYTSNATISYAGDQLVLLGVSGGLNADEFTF